MVIEHTDHVGPISESKLAKFIQERVRELYVFPTTGRDHDRARELCGGIAVVAELNQAPKAHAASFFVVTPHGQLSCVDPPRDGRAAPLAHGTWVIAHERPEAYFQRVGNRQALLWDPFSQRRARQERPARPEEE